LSSTQSEKLAGHAKRAHVDDRELPKNPKQTKRYCTHLVLIMRMRPNAPQSKPSPYRSSIGGFAAIVEPFFA
jgi:hypothetical protein